MIGFSIGCLIGGLPQGANRSFLPVVRAVVARRAPG